MVSTKLGLLGIIKVFFMAEELYWVLLDFLHVYIIKWKVYVGPFDLCLHHTDVILNLNIPSLDMI